MDRNCMGSISEIADVLGPRDASDLLNTGPKSCGSIDFNLIYLEPAYDLACW